MAIYAVSFKLDYDADYDRRYEKLINAIRLQANGPKYWEETTSFVLLDSDLSPGSLADAIVGAGGFDKTKDLLVVLYLSGKKGHAIRGHYADKDVLTLLAER